MLGRIVHICLTGPYIKGMGYHENIVPYYHRKMGFEVFIFSVDSLLDKRIDDEVDENGIHLVRLERGKRYWKISQFGDFPELYYRLELVKPDYIYIHNVNFISMFDVIKYKKSNPEVKIFADNHNDYYNSPIKGFKSHILNYIIFRYMIRKSLKYVQVFWGVTPWRCQYLNKVYGVPFDKIELLEMGGDNRYIDFEHKEEIRLDIRDKLGISKNAFLLVTGGKINLEKGTHLLAKSVFEINNNNLKLLIFGKIESDVSSELEQYIDNKRVYYTGWKEPKEYYKDFLASDLAVFPGTHSILWEQACACGIPIVVKNWKEMHHIDLGGNAFFLKDCTVGTLKETINYIISNKKVYDEALAVAQSKGVVRFSYERISKKAIGLADN